MQRFQFFRDTGASSALTYSSPTRASRRARGDRIHGPYLDPRREWTAPSTTSGHAPRPPRPARQRLGTGASRRTRRGPAPHPRPAQLLRGASDASAGGERRASAPTTSACQADGDRTASCAPTVVASASTSRSPLPSSRISPSSYAFARRTGSPRPTSSSSSTTFKPAKNIDKFERYDHMISGWHALKDRYTKHCTAPPLVAFVCRDQANAKEFCRAADPVVTAGHAYGGEYSQRMGLPGATSAWSSLPNATSTMDAWLDTPCRHCPRRSVSWRRTARTPQRRATHDSVSSSTP